MEKCADIVENVSLGISEVTSLLANCNSLYNPITDLTQGPPL